MGDTLEKLKARQARQVQREIEEANKRRQLEMRIRKEEKAREMRQAVLIGETIRDAELTPDERAVIAGILARRKLPPKDWVATIGNWLPTPTEGPSPAPDISGSSTEAAE